MEIQERGESSNTDSNYIPGMELGFESNSIASCSSNRGSRGVNVEQCGRCESVTSPLFITVICVHKFCGECIAYLLSRQELGEPCVCPFDGKKIAYIRPSTLDEAPEEIACFAYEFNSIFIPPPPPFMPHAKYGGFLTRLYCVDTALFLTGLFAYFVKFS